MYLQTGSGRYYGTVVFFSHLNIDFILFLPSRSESDGRVLIAETTSSSQHTSPVARIVRENSCSPSQAYVRTAHHIPFVLLFFDVHELKYNNGVTFTKLLLLEVVVLRTDTTCQYHGIKFCITPQLQSPELF